MYSELLQYAISQRREKISSACDVSFTLHRGNVKVPHPERKWNKNVYEHQKKNINCVVNSTQS